MFAAFRCQYCVNEQFNFVCEDRASRPIEWSMDELVAAGKGRMIAVDWVMVALMPKRGSPGTRG